MTNATIERPPAVAPPASGREASYRKVGSIHLLKLRGSFREMGRQHGAFLKEAIPLGPLPYYRTLVKQLVGGTAGPFAYGLLNLLVGRRIVKKLPPFATETLQGLADGSGLPYRDILEGCTMPDTLLYAVSRLISSRRIAPAVDHRLALGLGCTSAIAWGDATSDGRLLHARNFDYHGAKAWPSQTSVIFHEPEKGHRYVAVSSAGIPLGGVTAMNAAGMTLTVHQHMFTNATHLGGTPIGLVGDIVMREADSLDAAEAILAAHRPIGCWTYLVTDGKTNEVLCYEENPERHRSFRYKEQDPAFGYANVYLDPELGRTERNLYGSYWRHNQGRHRKVRQLLSERSGSLDPAGMAAILADRGDPRCRIRDSIAMVLTVGSVVFRPEDGTLWVGSGLPPTSRSKFVPFSLKTEDHAPELGELQVKDGESDAARRAFEQYREADVAFLDEGDDKAALDSMEEACRLAPDQPLYHFVSGILSLRTGLYERAERAFCKAIELGHPDPERVAAFHLWRGRSRDLLQRRDDAIADYRASLALRSDKPVAKAAAKGLKRRFSARRAGAIRADLSFADVVLP